MKINADEVVSVKLTYRQIARLYAITGKVAGGSQGSSSWNIFSELLGDKFKDKYHNFIYHKNESDVFKYGDYEEQWEKILFGPPKSEAEIQLEKLENKIKELQEEAQKLKETMQK
jgi:hypothetical protein